MGIGGRIAGARRRNVAAGLTGVMLAAAVAIAVTAGAFAKSAGEHRNFLFRPDAVAKGTGQQITLNSVPPEASRGLGLAFEVPQVTATNATLAQAEQAASGESDGPVREAVLAVVHSLNGNQVLDGRRLWVISVTPPTNDQSLTTGQEIHPTVRLVFVDPDTGKPVETAQYAGR